MNEPAIRYLSWVALALALLSWTGVGWFVFTIMQDKNDRTARLQNTQEFSTRHDVAVRAHALAVDTASERARLDEILNVDIISAIDMIEAAGKAAKVNMQLSNAQPESAPSSGGGKVQAVGFVVSGQGNFASLMRILRLFETLPLPSTLSRFDLEHVPGSGSDTGSWRLNAYIRILTTAGVSS